ncbi:hypothetical protein BU17DRAFT_74184 [Hysterangium stoloniferum]|nr:hypothetical protein BU17DRAFT_74184 [Hysterangium stoloniferum]
MPPTPSSSRALAAILPQIATAPYEAHQKARTFASRYVKASQYDVAIDVLFQSARELLKVGQQGSGTDLGGFLIDVYEAKEETVTDESRGRLTQLIALTGSNGSWRKKLIEKSISWSAKFGPCPAGDPDIHHYAGELLFKEGALDLAEPHFLAAGKRDSARLLAQLMVEWLNDSPEIGLFAPRGVIPYLLEGNILAARTFLSHFISNLITSRPNILAQSSPLIIGETSDEIFVTTDQVLNFLQLAIRTCQRAQGDKNKTIREAWVRLCGSYQSKGGLMASPPMRKALSEIGQLYFGFPPPRGQAGNPLQDMFSSLFGGEAGPVQPRTLTPAVTPGSGIGLD